MTVPKPLPSPRPQYDGSDLDTEPITASRMPATMRDVRRVRFSGALTLLVTVVGGFGAVAASIRAVESVAAEKGAQAAKDAGALAADTRDELRRHVAESAQETAALKSDVHEVQMDIRALYRSQQTHQPSPRLERPPPPRKDGGP